MYPNDPILKKAYLENKKISSDSFDYFGTCEYNNCLFTCDESLHNVSDALMFHASSKNNSKRYRSKDQVYMLWNDEARGGNLESHYNWTITFKLDSEISYCSYGCYIPLEREITHDIKSFEVNKNIDIRKEYEKRKNEALWFVSNCGSSFRLKYADKLSEYFPINFFGGCNSQLSSKKAKIETAPCPRNSECEENSLRSHKFYLAFENSNCSYYTTEKFWRSLEFNIIPVVIQPNKEYYIRIAPKDTFIHAQDFNYDHKLLANYLEKVSKNFKLYKKYLEWSKNYKPLYDAKSVEQMRMCELCYRLNKESSAISYKSMNDYMNDGCDK
jgi:glycoprotein 3-alpha-L-fucosyltransferase